MQSYNKTNFVLNFIRKQRKTAIKFAEETDKRAKEVRERDADMILKMEIQNFKVMSLPLAPQHLRPFGKLLIN